MRTAAGPPRRRTPSTAGPRRAASTMRRIPFATSTGGLPCCSATRRRGTGRQGGCLDHAGDRATGDRQLTNVEAVDVALTGSLRVPLSGFRNRGVRGAPGHGSFQLFVGYIFSDSPPLDFAINFLLRSRWAAFIKFPRSLHMYARESSFGTRLNSCPTCPQQVAG